MKTIKDYIESLFLGIPVTAETQQLKEDLLANAEDRYDDLKLQGKTEHEAIGAVISEFGNIDELLEELDLKQETISEPEYEMDEINVDDALSFLGIQRRSALFIGLGVMIILLGLSGFFAIQAFSFNENLGGVLGIVAIFVGVAIGVPLFIIAGTSLSREKEKLNDRLIPTQVKNEVKIIKERFQRSFVFCMVVGVSLCIAAVIPPVALSGVLEGSVTSDFYSLIGLALFMICVSLGVFLFIYGGVIMGSFTQLIEPKYFISDEDKLGPKAKADLNKHKTPFLQLLEKIYWPIVVGIYLFHSFNTGTWGYSWMIFPGAAILFWILESIFSKND